MIKDAIMDNAQQDLESYFSTFRQNIIGINEEFTDAYGHKKVLYADWIASGRLYQPIEDILVRELGPFVSNPHSYSSYTGQQVTHAYAEARNIIKRHVNANDDDVLVTTGSGMTGALMRFLEIIGIKSKGTNKEEDRPVVFITHMEHHSNHVSWMEADADVVVLPPAEEILVDSSILAGTLEKYKDRKVKIGAFTACSNVTGIITPYYEMAELMHQHGGYCIVDFAASAPYVDMDMHPENPNQKLDAICFSPHKFLGGPGGCGVLVFDKKLHCGIPCVPGGGNVTWTDPWGGFGYTSNIEALEDGGTPGFMQAIRAALSIRLKDEMGVANMKKRDNELIVNCFAAFNAIMDVDVIGGTNSGLERIGAVAFNIKDMHYNLVVRILNDRFGVQARGGWSCASTYGHYLFDIDKDSSKELGARIDASNMTGKPGWVRISLHPTMTNVELEEIIDAVKEICTNKQWADEYYFEPTNNEYYPNDKNNLLKVDTDRFFQF